MYLPQLMSCSFCIISIILTLTILTCTSPHQPHQPCLLHLSAEGELVAFESRRGDVGRVQAATNQVHFYRTQVSLVIIIIIIMLIDMLIIIIIIDHAH